MVEMLLQARADVGQRRNDPEVAMPDGWDGPRVVMIHGCLKTMGNI
jgi:hypothetical protein